MLKHQYLTKYKQAIQKEFSSLINRKTFEYKEYINNKKLVLLI
jgi:hypothetical protein